MKRAPSTFTLVLTLVAVALLLALALTGALQRRVGRQVMGDSYGRLAAVTALAVDELAARPQEPATRQLLAQLAALGVVLRDGAPPASAPRRPPAALRAIAATAGAVLAAPTRVQVRSRPAAQLWVRSAHAPARWIVLQLPSYRQRLLDSTLAISLLAGLLALAAAGLAARVLTRPLERLARHAPSLLAGAPLEPMLAGTPREVRRLGEAIGAAGGQLRAVAQERELMLAGISHDLRTPLARLRIALELGDAGEPQRRAAMEADLEELDRALEQCLAFVRDGRDEAAERLDLGTLCGQLLALRAQPEHWQLQAPGALPVIARPTLLRRALANLMDNAERYGMAPFELTLALQDDTVNIEVADHGPGVPPALLARLGQPFLRGDPARGGGGSGLGLSIVTRAARLHGGSVRFANRVDGGFLATLRLPAARR